MFRIAVSAHTSLPRYSVEQACRLGHRRFATARRLYSNDSADPMDKNKVSDDKHEALAKHFVNIIRTANSKPKESNLQKIETAEATEDHLIGTLEEFFSLNKPIVTPELLQLREELRRKYPKMFEKISDTELDS